MTGLWDRLEGEGGETVIRGCGVALSDISRRLEGGESLDQVGEDLHLKPADLLAALAQLSLGDELSEAPPLVQARPRRPFLLGAASEPMLARILPGSSHPGRLALAAGLLQALDFWEESHEAAQAAGDLGEIEFSSYWHGVAHRREPDAGNAAYWFRKVGRHRLFGPLGASARAFLTQLGDPALADRISPNGTWNPSAMIELCGKGAARPGSPDEVAARRLQRLEMAMLLEATAAKIM